MCRTAGIVPTKSFIRLFFVTFVVFSNASLESSFNEGQPITSQFGHSKRYNDIRKRKVRGAGGVGAGGVGAKGYGIGAGGGGAKGYGIGASGVGAGGVGAKGYGIGAGGVGAKGYGIGASEVGAGGVGAKGYGIGDGGVGAKGCRTGIFLNGASSLYKSGKAFCSRLYQAYDQWEGSKILRDILTGLSFAGMMYLVNGQVDASIALGICSTLMSFCRVPLFVNIALALCIESAVGKNFGETWKLGAQRARVDLLSKTYHSVLKPYMNLSDEMFQSSKLIFSVDYPLERLARDFVAGDELVTAAFTDINNTLNSLKGVSLATKCAKTVVSWLASIVCSPVRIPVRIVSSVLGWFR